MLHQKVIDQDTDVFRKEFLAFFSIVLGAFLPGYLVFFQPELQVVSFFSRTVTLDHILSLYDGGDRGGVCRGSSYPQLLQFLDQAGLGVSVGGLRETLNGPDLTCVQVVSCFQERQGQRGFSVVFLGILVGTFPVHFQEAFKNHHLSGSHELLARVSATDGDLGLVYLRICHLRGKSPFPYQFVQFLIRGSSFHRNLIHESGADGFMGFLCPFGTGGILPCLAVPGSESSGDDLFCQGKCHFGQLCGIGTHVCDMPRFIKTLCHAHGLAHRKSQFAGSFLLQG